MMTVVQTTVLGQWTRINALEHLQCDASGGNYSTRAMDMVYALEHLQCNATGTNYSTRAMGMD